MFLHVQLYTENIIPSCGIITGLRWACLCSAGLIAVGSSLRCVTDDPYAAKWQVTSDLKLITHIYYCYLFH